MSPKQDTRQLILDAALRLFEERGYAATTIRAIAGEAGVTPSNAYYWFSSKDELVQAFYVRIQAEHSARAAVGLARGGTLVERVRAVEHAFLDVIADYHGFGQAFVSLAIAPDGPDQALSDAAAPTREQSKAIYREVVAGATPKVPAALREMLPELLWLSHLGIGLFWVVDSSPEQERTRRLIDATTPLIAPMVKVAGLPWGGAVVDQVRAALGIALEPR